jgi:hypothetical protein
LTCNRSLLCLRRRSANHLQLLLCIYKPDLLQSMQHMGRQVHLLHMKGLWRVTAG